MLEDHFQAGRTLQQLRQLGGHKDMPVIDGIGHLTMHAQRLSQRLAGVATHCRGWSRHR